MDDDELAEEDVDFVTAMSDTDTDEAYLGEATLAKLRSGDFSFGEGDGDSGDETVKSEEA